MQLGGMSNHSLAHLTPRYSCFLSLSATDPGADWDAGASENTQCPSPPNMVLLGSVHAEGSWKEMCGKVGAPPPPTPRAVLEQGIPAGGGGGGFYWGPLPF